MVLLQEKTWLLPGLRSTPKGQKDRESRMCQHSSSTDANLSYHILRAHYQIMLRKAADQQTPPFVDIAAYGWELVSGAGRVPTSRIARGPAAPPALMDVINCQCKAVGKACSSHECSCHFAGLSCTPYCYCVGEVMCFKPFTKHDGKEARHDNEDEGDIFDWKGGHLEFVSREHRHTSLKIMTLNSSYVDTLQVFISRIIKAVHVYTSTVFLPIC